MPKMMAHPMTVHKTATMVCMPVRRFASIDVRASGLRQAREMREMTRAELALLAVTTSSTLAALEEGVHAARDGALRVRLLRALDADFDEIFQVVAIDVLGRILQ